MKKLSIVLSICMLLIMLTACSGSTEKSDDNSSAVNTEASTKNNSTSIPENTTTSTDTSSDILVVNFSCTGNTKAIADKVTEMLGADFYEITPAIPYTDADLSYNDDNCRANKEQNDEFARPEIAGEKLETSAYDTVIISFPIWWDKEPRIIDTFMETYDFSDKTLTCFCTSGSSGISTAEANLHTFEPEATWLDGIRFSAGATDNEIQSWLTDIGMK